MNLSSLQYLLQSAKKSLVRFPLVLFSALLVFFMGAYLIATDFDSTDKISTINILLLAMTGVPLFFSIKVFAEQSKNTQKLAWLGNVIGFLILVGFGIYLPSTEGTGNTHMPYIRFGLFNIFIHLIVAIAPFPNKGNQNGFWQYNRMLFTRFFL